MRDLRSAEAGGAHRAGATAEPGKQAFVAVMVGAAALSVAMLLMLLAAWRASSSVTTGGDPTRSTSAQAEVPSVEINRYEVRAKPGTHGSQELIVEGYMTNTGPRSIEAADLRCYFATNSGDMTHFDFPLVVDSYLDSVGDGPLPPMAGRKFAVRVGEFPRGVSSEIKRSEVINIRLESG